MRIVHVVSYFNIRMKYQEYYLAKEQVSQGHEVYVLTSERNFPFSDYTETAKSVYGDRLMKTGEFLEEGIRIIRLSVIWEFRGRVLLKKMRKTLINLNPDIVFIHGIVNFFSFELLLRPIDARFVFDDHMLYNQIDKTIIGKTVFLIFRFLLKNKLLQIAEKIVAISDGCVPVINQYYGIPIERISMIPLGADAKLFRFDSSQRSEVRHRYNIDPDTVVIIYTGKLTRNKMPHLIISALNNTDLGVKIHILFVGNINDEYRNEFHDELSHSSYPCTVCTQVNSDELVKLFNASDIAVYPAQATISTVEASACSLPIICTTEISERYKNGNGFGIDPGNLAQLKKYLAVLLLNRNLRETMGKKGREYVENELSWEILSQRFLALKS